MLLLIFSIRVFNFEVRSCFLINEIWWVILKVILMLGSIFIFLIIVCFCIIIFMLFVGVLRYEFMIN